MRRAIHDATACREALLRLPKLGLDALRQQWRVLYKAEASPYLSRELLLRAVAYRMQDTGCRRSLSAASARSGSVSSVNLLSSSTGAKRCGYVLVPS